MKPIMTDQELFTKVAQMRDWQKSYFQYRTSDALARAKECEREIDKELERRKNPDTQQSLFTVQPPQETTEPPKNTYIQFGGYTEKPDTQDVVTYVYFDNDGCLHFKTVTNNRHTGNRPMTTGMMNFDKPNTLALVEFLDKMCAVDQWIKTAERRPDGEAGIVDVLIRHEGRTWKAIYICKLKQFEIYHEATEETEVVNPEWWMPMPGEPKGGETC